MIFSRHTAFAALMLGATAGPYAVSSLKDAGPWTAETQPAAGAAAEAARQPAANASSFEGQPLGGYVASIPEVFRFDVTTAWVLGHWPRVSTALAELDLQGYRVPLSTGPRPSDVAGSLTYYFNRNRQVERIEFQGTTGDARELVAWLATSQGFQRARTNDPSVYLYRVLKHGRPISELVISPSHIVRSDAPHARFEVSLVMRRA